MLGLCLSGGGARGAYQIGVCMALQEAGILDEVEYFSGTSIGAVNAVMLACLPVEKVKELWFDMPDDVLNKTESFFKRLWKENKNFLKNGIYDLSVLRKVVKKNIDFAKLKEKKVFVTLSDAGAAGGGLTSLLKESYLHYIKHNNRAVYSKIWEQSRLEIIQQIMASCSIPAIFPPTTIDGKQYYDGGVYDNVPVAPLVKAGCKRIIVIHLDKLPYNYVKKYPEIDFMKIVSHKSLGLKLNFDPLQSEIRYNYGYADGKEFTKELLNLKNKNLT
ncbi:MAG: patatin-like phospholipase family protein [Tenericutes bacterium]|nr:patatin-like phospholipase family protein [Mycoplasmatota bacterium]